MTEATEKRGGKFLDLPSFYCTMQENQKRNLKPTAPYQTLFSGSRQNVIWSAQRKSVPKSSNLLVKKPGIAWNVICFLFCFLYKSQNTFDPFDKLDILDLYKCWKVCLHPNFLCFSACFPVPCVLCWLVSKSFFIIWIQSGYLELKLNWVVLHFLYFYVTQVCVYLFEKSK